MLNKLKNIIKKLTFKSYTYWEKRYQSGGTSGAGSYGKLAEFKADVINEFIKKNKIKSIIEFGCGDGNQLGLFNVKKYVGLDVSKRAIEICKDKFNSDMSKSFFLYSPKHFIDRNGVFKSDLVLSLDVIYHLIEEDIFEKYMQDIFNSSNKYVIIYSTNTNDNKNNEAIHIKNRKFTTWIKNNKPKWKLIKLIKNKYKDMSKCNFYIYKKSR